MRAPRRRRALGPLRTRKASTPKHAALLAREKRARDGIDYIGDTATEKIIALACEIGEDECPGLSHGWKAAAARRMGLKYKTLHNVLQGDRGAGLHAIQQVAEHTGYSIAQLFGEK